MTHVALKDELLDAQLLRTLGTAPYGGADIGECLATAAQLDGTSLTARYDAWVATAERTGRLAESELARGRIETARGAFLRGANYFRTAGVMLMGAPLDSRLREANRRQTDMLRRGAALLAQPPEILTIPFGATTLLSLRAYSLKGRAEMIACPSFVCHAEGDDISTSAPLLFDALRVDRKEYVSFTAAEGAGDHCEAGARTLYHARSFVWLDGVLKPDAAYNPG